MAIIGSRAASPDEDEDEDEAEEEEGESCSRLLTARGRAPKWSDAVKQERTQ